MNFKDKLNKMECKEDLPKCKMCEIVSKAQEIKKWCSKTFCIIKNPGVGNNKCPFIKRDDEGLYCELTETESFPWDWNV